MNTRIALAFVLIFGFCARAATYKSPLLDHHAWRQADTASISRNFFRERFNILYPQIDERGAAANGYVETGLELFAFIVAATANVVGFHSETGRLLSSALFVCSDLLVWTFVRRRYGTRAGVAAAFLYAFAFPLLVFIERAFMNEALLICLSLVCLVAAQDHVQSGGARSALTLIVASALIGAIKLPYLIIWAPVLGLFVERDGLRLSRRWALAGMVFVDLAVAALWYRHAHVLGTLTGFSFNMTDKLFDPHVVFSWEFPVNLIKRLFKDVLGPVGFVGASAGLWFAVRERRWMELFGACGFVAYLILVAAGNDVHDYYQLAIIPLASSLVTLGVIRLVDSASHPRHRRAALASVLAAALIATFIRSVSAHSWYEYSESEASLCHDVTQLTRIDERVVVLGTSDPAFLFCVDRKGWLFSPADSDREHVRRAVDEGARIMIVPTAPEYDAVRQFIAESAASLAQTADQRAFRWTRQQN